MKFKYILFIFSLIVLFVISSCKNGQYSEESTYYDVMEDACKDIPIMKKGGEELVSEPEFNTEEYDRIYENPFRDAGQNPLSTFSIDVDNASYSNVRRFLEGNQMPYPDAVRIEEMINYFTYDYPQPAGQQPFKIVTEIAECPWNNSHKLVHIGLQGKSLDYENLKPSNLVFLLDVSGSMDENNKLPLVKQSIKLMLDNLNGKDRVAIVVYAGAAGQVLPSTSIDNKDEIYAAIKNLEAGGSTAGGEGIELAYAIAKENLIPDGNNRVILATDGDFNIGTSSTGDLVRLIEEKREEDIYLTICGFGMGNYKDNRMEQISNAGNGNYFYIDNIMEAEKVFVKELRANLFTIAKDVKIQVEFNPANVKSYRLVGYENRVMANEDFNDDTKDAGELGAGHTVTALYEIIPFGSEDVSIEHDNLKYQNKTLSDNASGSEIMTIKFRYKPIGSKDSKLLSQVVRNKDLDFSEATENLKFSSAVAGFGMLLRDSEYKGNMTYSNVLKIAKSARGNDDAGYRSEFIQLVKKAKLLSDNEF